MPRSVAASIVIAFFTLLSEPVIGQTWIPLFDFEQVWRYETSGTDLGTAWRTNHFDDAGWPLGPGLLETGETSLYPAPFSTTLPPTDGKVAYYFRTRFDVPAEALAAGWQLFATNLVDDGCVIYLNGVEAGKVRMPSVFNYLTLATAGPITEGQFDVVELSAPGIHVGENVIAVEVHQVSSTSGDLVWGMNLAAAVPQPVAILAPPTGGAYLVGDTVTLSVMAEGSPIFYQWQKDGQNIAGATKATYSFVATTELNSGKYTVVVTNRVGRAVSAPADVSVFPDRRGPVIYSAIVVETAPTNKIDMLFSKAVESSTTRTTNFQVIRIWDGQQVTVSNALVSRSTVRLVVGGTNWNFFDDYFVLVSNVKDSNGNSVAPGTRVPVSWKIRSRLFDTGQNWTILTAIGDPDVYNQPWMENGYIPGASWSTAPGPFFQLRCEDSSGTRVDTGAQPLLLRTSFNWPASNPSTAELNLSYAFDDGAIFYLNGVELYRFNVPAGRPTLFSRALTPFSTSCSPTTALTTNVTLLAGENLLAAAVLQQQVNFEQIDILFSATLDSTHLRTPKLPEEPAPSLNISQISANVIRLSWPGGGYWLESATDLSNALSYPVGPWQVVTNMANPMVYSLDSPFRFFRLRTP